MLGPTISGSADDDQLRTRDGGLLEGLKQIVDALARIDGKHRQDAKRTVFFFNGMKIIQVDGW